MQFSINPKQFLFLCRNSTSNRDPTLPLEGHDFHSIQLTLAEDAFSQGSGYLAD